MASFPNAPPPISECGKKHISSIQNRTTGFSPFSISYFFPIAVIPQTSSQEKPWSMTALPSNIGIKQNTARSPTDHFKIR
jgi:hypothetical protein